MLVMWCWCCCNNDPVQKGGMFDGHTKTFYNLIDGQCLDLKRAVDGKAPAT